MPSILFWVAHLEIASSYFRRPLLIRPSGGGHSYLFIYYFPIYDSSASILRKNNALCLENFTASDFSGNLHEFFIFSSITFSYTWFFQTYFHFLVTRMKFYYFALFLSIIILCISTFAEGYSYIRSDRVKRGDPECLHNCRSRAKSRGACVWRTFLLNWDLKGDYFAGTTNVCPEYYVCLCFWGKPLYLVVFQ